MSRSWIVFVLVLAQCTSLTLPDTTSSSLAAEPRSFESQATPNNEMIPGVCYSPMHNAEYPLFGGSAAGLDAAMRADFAVLKKYFTIARTYYSSFYGIPVAPAAASNGVKLYLGVYMTRESWYTSQVNDAIAAVKNYPNTIAAILVGNENIWPAGGYSSQEVINAIVSIRTRLKNEAGRTDIPVGTVQRSTEWLNPNTRAEFATLAATCDIIGVNIYPFFDNGYDPANPMAILDAQWNQMVTWYPDTKVRLTETGWPTQGTPSSISPRNPPSLANSVAFYSAFTRWNPARGGRETFWFMFYDRSPQDNSMGVELEKYFGFFTYQRNPKTSSNYPIALASASTPAPPTSAPTTISPAMSSFLGAIGAGAGNQVCRVKKRVL